MNKRIKILTVFSILYISAIAILQAQNCASANKCFSVEVKANQAVFHCNDSINVLFKLCSPSIIKLYYEQGDFHRNNPSFAVINEDIDDKGDISLSEQAGSFEIYTSDLIIRVIKDPFQIRFYDKYQKLLLEDIQGKAFIKDSDYIASYKNLRPDEHIFGLGEKNGSIDRRGKTYKMWNSDKPCYSVNEDPLYKSIPFFMSNYGYGIFFDNTYKSVFKFGTESDNYYSFEALGGEMVYYFIFGPDYDQIIEQYVQLTGKPIMPPDWAFGFSQCRGLLTNEKLTREIADGYRQRQIPCDIIYQDIGWTQNLQDFEWRKGNYNNPQKMISDLADSGFKVIVSQDPVISQGNTKQWKEADSLGYFTTDSRTGKTYDMPWPWGGNCGVVDFTKPSVADWWGNYQQKVLDDSVKGFWTDMGEPAWSNEESTERLFMKHYQGMHNEMHNVYGFTWDKVVTEQFEKHNPNKRIFQMTRAGYAGLQRYTFGWSGDSGDGNNVLDGWNKLANQIPLALSAGLGVIPFWATDISGYCGDIKDYEAFSELYIRWLQFGVFNPLSRAHHEGNNAVEPWLFGNGATSICKRAIELKYQFFPYIYTYAHEAYNTGLPLMRAMLLEFPSDEEAVKAESQFMFGKELLVAPVVKKGARTKRLYLPEGNWIDFNNEKTVYEGSQWIDYPVSLETTPILVKEGSIIPMMPVMQYIHEKKNYPLFIKIFPATGSQSISFNLYEDDGETNNYKKDICATTTFTCQTTKDGYEITIGTRKENGYSLQGKRNIVLEIPNVSRPKNIIVNNIKLKTNSENKLLNSVDSDFEKNVWSWDKDSSKCYVKMYDDGALKAIRVLK